ncbi:D-amino-acid oxidase [Brevundimonas sp. LM2]|uniref:FAD-dependent oxidoreductase n=1 Tax=Brevundimonas sp. LM2 TaxID=1938605 RepID=UPI000983D436|nr:FAD-dependent oxidoreductase [Brevundimonas sp. LM2]AQR62417.1 D-amino-acid oxidase [Brevundimonas sp. LM2]
MPASSPGSRRSVLMGLGGLALGGPSLGGCVTAPPPAPRARRPRFVAPPLAPYRLDPSLITRITVCTRPFRPQGPRIEAETVGDKRVVHNYGHGGSGWSLSWGSAEIVRGLALEGGTREVAVIGCGALGLTAATLLQRAGAKVTIYAAERVAQARSARATGLWTPDSRIADLDRVDPVFPALWERMARSSWAMHQTYVGLPGEPVAFLDRYALQGGPQVSGRMAAAAPAPTPAGPARVRFAEYASRLNDIVPQPHALDRLQHPFPVQGARVGPNMQFNIAELGHRLMSDFLAEGGRIEPRTFRAPGDLAALAEPVVVNCTGYGARALFGDDSLVPVRGQMTWLPPQPEVRYSVYYDGVGLISRPDGVGVQALRGGDMVGYGDAKETIDRAEAEAAILRAAVLFEAAGFKA